MQSFFMEEIVQELFEQGVLVHDAVGAGLVPARIEAPTRGRPYTFPRRCKGSCRSD